MVSNHRSGSLERQGLEPRGLADTYPGLIYVSLTCYGSSGPWAHRGGFDMNASAASGVMTIEGTQAEPRLPVTGLLNDYITGYLGAVGAAAALAKRATEGGSWHVTVNLTRAAMWCGSLGLVDPALAGRDAEHSLREAPGPLRRPHPTGRRPHARPASPVLRHRTRLASTAPRPQRLKPSRMADLTLPGAQPHVTTEVRPHDRRPGPASGKSYWPDVLPGAVPGLIDLMDLTGHAEGLGRPCRGRRDTEARPMSQIPHRRLVWTRL